jgi:large subunit ribosomal protein L45
MSSELPTGKINIFPLKFIINLCDFLKVFTLGYLQFFRHRSQKHWSQKYRRMRSQKVIKVELPDMEEKFNELTPEKQRSKMKERGIAPPRPYFERPFFISCTGGIFEPYVPIEGDGVWEKAGGMKGLAKEKLQFLEKKGKSMLAVRKIRSFEEDFEPPEFANQAQEIYMKAHEKMKDKKKYELREYVTERAYPEMMHNIYDKTIRWQFLQTLEPPTVIHARCTDVITKENIYGQVTVRFHTQQKLAIYDRFGRIMYGSEIIPKDVLEYVVFEKHLSNEYGKWRLHGKIIPDWVPPRPSTYRTFIEEPEKVQEIEDKEKEVSRVLTP